MDIDIQARDSHDTCLISSWTLIEPVLIPLLEEGLSQSFEDALTSSMTEINDALCLLTSREIGIVGRRQVHGTGTLGD